MSHASYLHQVTLGRRLLADDDQAPPADTKRHVTPKVGERVVFAEHSEAGTVTEVVRQKHTDDLLRVNWDGDTAGVDRDLYSWAFLEREVPSTGTRAA